MSSIARTVLSRQCVRSGRLIVLTEETWCIQDRPKDDNAKRETRAGTLSSPSSSVPSHPVTGTLPLSCIMQMEECELLYVDIWMCRGSSQVKGLSPFAVLLCFTNQSSRESTSPHEQTNSHDIHRTQAIGHVAKCSLCSGEVLSMLSLADGVITALPFQIQARGIHKVGLVGQLGSESVGVASMFLGRGSVVPD